MLLALVFIPRGLQYGDQPPQPFLDLALATPSEGARILVSRVTTTLNVASYRVVLRWNDTTAATLDAGLSGGSSNAGFLLHFTDANADGLLDPGDFFPIQVPYDGTYRFEVYEVGASRLVGLVTWTGRV